MTAPSPPRLRSHQMPRPTRASRPVKAAQSPRSPDGYRRRPGVGPHIRSDIIDVYVFRRAPRSQAARSIQLLQLLRTKPPLDATWHPIMGHIEPAETAVEAAFRELTEEVGLSPSHPAFISAWALEQVHPFFIAKINSIVLSPRFAVEVARSWTPTLNHEHARHRWIPYSKIAGSFMWPGQLAAINELVQMLRPGALAQPLLRLPR